MNRVPIQAYNPSRRLSTRPNVLIVTAFPDSSHLLVHTFMTGILGALRPQHWEAICFNGIGSWFIGRIALRWSVEIAIWIVATITSGAVFGALGSPPFCNSCVLATVYALQIPGWRLVAATMLGSCSGRVVCVIHEYYINRELVTRVWETVRQDWQDTSEAICTFLLPPKPPNTGGKLHRLANWTRILTNHLIAHDSKREKPEDCQGRSSEDKGCGGNYPFGDDRPSGTTSPLDKDLPAQ
ncbi:hypothetical protein TruAng_008450 [Truncatella angustata]|nr:hypothetical protein TruAng_008450 [Truncatella angustata]